MRGIKRITEYAKSKKLIGFDPLADYPIGREKIPRPKYLNSVQLRIWIDHPFVSPAAQKVADVFVLYSRKGFHYLDLPDQKMTIWWIQFIGNNKSYRLKESRKR